MTTLRDLSSDASGTVVPSLGDLCVGGRVLVVGDVATAHLLRDTIGDAVDVRFVASSDESEGIDIDIVVIAGSFPLLELTQLRVHPRLGVVPAIVVMGGRSADDLDWSALNASVLLSATQDSLVSAVRGSLLTHRAIA